MGVTASTVHYLLISDKFNNLEIKKTMKKYKNGLYFGLEEFNSIENFLEEITSVEEKASYLYTYIMYACPMEAYRYMFRLKEIIESKEFYEDVGNFGNGFYNYHFENLPSFNKLGKKINTLVDYNCMGNTHRFFEPEDFIDTLLYEEPVDIDSYHTIYYKSLKSFLFNPESMVKIIPICEKFNKLIDDTKNLKDMKIFVSYCH